MSENMKYITVILPLKLDWEPYYSAKDENVHVGSRVKVMFSGRQYTGVVSSTGSTPPPGINIKEIIAAENGLPDIFPEEISFWKTVADYYMCTVGEVYKAAYPAMKTSQEQSFAKKLQREQEKKEKLLSEYRAKGEKADNEIEKCKTRLAEMLAKEAADGKLKLAFPTGKDAIGIELNMFHPSDYSALVLEFNIGTPVDEKGSVELWWGSPVSCNRRRGSGKVALPLQATIVLSNMLFQSIGKALQATLISATRQGIYFIPLILLLPRYFGLTGIEFTQSISDVFAFLSALPFLFFFFRSLNRNMRLQSSDETEAACEQMAA